MIFRQLFEPDSCTYTYLLACPETKKALLIDPVLETVERDLTLIDELGLKLERTLETHTHADHVTGAGELRRRRGSKIAVSRHGPDCADEKLSDGDVIEMGTVRIEVIETPGHTDDSLSFKCEDKVFTGDTMLLRRTGRSDFQNGNTATLYDSVSERLLTLPPATRVYPCHDYDGRTMSTIEEEKRLGTVGTMPRDSFIEMMDGMDRPKPRKFDVAVPANLKCGVPE